MGQGGKVLRGEGELIWESDVGQLQRLDSAREASGVPPIASENCALRNGSKGQFRPSITLFFGGCRQELL